MEMIKNVSRWGNSSGILVPKEWQGKQVKVILIDRTDEIKKEIFSILNDYLKDIMGIYLVGSYARGEQEENSDIDIIALSNKTKKEISSGKYNISIYPLESARKTIKTNPIMIYPRLFEAQTILNEKLLQELIKIEISNKIWKEYVEETKRIIKINEELMNIDKDLDENETSGGIAYSLLLRLRGILIIKKLPKILYREEFKNYLKDKIGNEWEKTYNAYQKKKIQNKEIKIPLVLGQKALDILKKEVKEYEKRKKT
ncbi:MAG: DUF2080 family transposase-associated protein [Nanoarchaeota archaeon]